MNKLAPHFFVSSSDGGLYDTRKPAWHNSPPLRAVFNRHFREINNTLELRATLRAICWHSQSRRAVFKFMKNEKCEYENNGERITAPGKFEGEPVFAPHFWQLALEGFSDNDDGRVFTFKFSFRTSDANIEFKPELQKWLGRKRTLKMREDSQGFVHCF